MAELPTTQLLRPSKAPFSLRLACGHENNANLLENINYDRMLSTEVESCIIILLSRVSQLTRYILLNTFVFTQTTSNIWSIGAQG